MPNFDSFERLLRQSLTEPGSRFECAQAIAELEDSKRPRFAREKSRDQIEGWLFRAESSLHIFLPDDTSFSSSDDNRSGKDLIGNNSSTAVELKSPDGKTDANPGTSTISWAVGDDSNLLSKKMTSTMKERRLIWLNRSASEAERLERIDSSKLDLAVWLERYFEERLGVGKAVPTRMRHFAYCVSVGLTKLPEIKASLQNSTVDLPLLLVADWDEGFKRYEQAFAPYEEVVTTSIVRDAQTHRVTVTMKGSATGRGCRLYPHYKNTYRARGEAVPASCWAATPCFHVWIDRSS